MNDTSLHYFYASMRKPRKTVYAIQKPQLILLNLAFTLINTYGKQECEKFNYYYHLFVYHSSMTRALLKTELPNGTDSSFTSVMNSLPTTPYRLHFAETAICETRFLINNLKQTEALMQFIRKKTRFSEILRLI